MTKANAARLIVPDVLRGFAILAMLIAHANRFLPDKSWAVEFVVSNFNAIASPLFALVMGMSAELMRRRAERMPVLLLQQVIRGLFLVALGVWMVTWGSWVDIVLAYLGVLLIVGAPLVLLNTPVLIAAASGILLVSQPLVQAARGWTWIYTAPRPVSDVMQWVFLGHNYRLINLLPMFLFGALLVRHGFQRDRLLWITAAIVLPAYAAWPLAERFGAVVVQSGDYLDSLKDLALVLAVYVCAVLAATSTRARRFWGVVFETFSSAGQVALSLYLLHVAVIAYWNTTYGSPTSNMPLMWALVVAGSMLIGWLWWRFVGTGPVEWVMGWLTGRRKHLRRAVAA